MQSHLFKSHVRTYKVGKLIRRYLTETFESCYLRVGTEVLDSLQTLFLAIAVASDEVVFLLFAIESCVSISHHLLVLDLCAAIAHTEQWGLQHIHMTLLYEVGEELQEEGNDKQSDVHTIHIGIGGNYHLVVAQGVETILNVERSLKQIELLVLVDHLLGQSV